MSRPRPRARYDGYADWYDETASRWGANIDPAAPEPVRDLLGVGTGRCLDLACGTSLGAEAIRATGREPIGLDLSVGQLVRGAARNNRVVLGDGAALPFRGASFPAVVALWMTTDVDDLAAVLQEVARVLEADGRLLLVAAHPCFNSPAAERLGDGSVRIQPTYRTTGWWEHSPTWGDNSLRRRVGAHHHTLADLFNALTRAGLRIQHVAEPGPSAVPNALTIVASASFPPQTW